MNPGTLLFARYAYMPNRLGYCGGEEHQELLQYCVARQSDAGLENLLRQFQAAYPYLQFISLANNIRDPFDARVVEAYWLGNSLLDGVDLAGFHRFLQSRFSTRLSPRALQYLLGKAPQGALPHHSFHVFDVHSRTGAFGPSLEAMEKCRIAAGKVLQIEPAQLLVSYQPLILEDGKLKLGTTKEKKVAHRVDSGSYLLKPEIGDLVSFHWDWVCDRISAQQASNLDKYTRHHLALANTTLSTLG